MYLFYDRNGTLKEQITTAPVRVGDSGSNKIYVYWDTEENVTNCYCRYKKPNGEYTTNDFSVHVPTEAQIPYDQDRDLKYFKYGQTYPFYVFTVPQELFMVVPDITVYSALFDCWFIYTDENEDDVIKTMGLAAFAVEPSTQSIALDQNINIAQWNELVEMVAGAGGHDFTNISVTNISFNNSIIPSETGLSVKDNEIYWRGAKLATYNDVIRVYTLVSSPHEFDSNADSDYVWLTENPHSTIYYQGRYYYKDKLYTDNTVVFHRWTAIQEEITEGSYNIQTTKYITLNTDSCILTAGTQTASYYTKTQIDSNYYPKDTIDPMINDALPIGENDTEVTEGDLQYCGTDNARLYYNGMYYEKSEVGPTIWTFSPAYAYINVSSNVVTLTKNYISINRSTGVITKETKSVNFYSTTGSDNLIHNGELEVKMGNTSLGTFTANQESDSIIQLSDAIGEGKLVLQVNGVQVGTFGANAVNDETVNLSIPTVNNGKLKIQVNGVQVGDSFYANQSENSVVNLQTSDLGINDATLTLKVGSKTVTFTANDADNATFEVTAADLGLTNAMHFIGKTTTQIEDGDTTNPITINGVSVTAVSGDITIYDNTEFVWSGSAWEELGNTSSFVPNTRMVKGVGALEGGGNLSSNVDISHVELNTSGAQGTSAMYKVTIDKYGHILSATQVAKSDVTALGIPDLAGSNVFTGINTFKDIIISNSNSNSYSIKFKYDNANSIDVYSEQDKLIITNGDDGIEFDINSGKITLFNPNDSYVYTLPSASGTFALTSDLLTKQDKITSTNKLESDLVDDTQQTHKFVTQAMYNWLETASYQAPSILTFSLEDNNQNIIPTTNEVGSLFTCSAIIFSMSNVANVSGNLTLTIGNYTQTITPSVGDEVILTTPQTISSTTSATLSGTDTKGNVFSKTYAMAFNSYTYTTHTSSTTTPTSSLAKQTGSSYSITYNAGDYIYFYNKSNGKSVQQNVLGTWTNLTSTNLGQVTITQNNGATGTYYCYRIGPFANGGTDTFRLA